MLTRQRLRRFWTGSCTVARLQPKRPPGTRGPGTVS